MCEIARNQVPGAPQLFEGSFEGVLVVPEDL